VISYTTPTVSITTILLNAVRLLDRAMRGYIVHHSERAPLVSRRHAWMRHDGLPDNRRK
jgi:hypothetical protein